jgi:hypothetical protein
MPGVSHELLVGLGLGRAAPFDFLDLFEGVGWIQSLLGEWLDTAPLDAAFYGALWNAKYFGHFRKGKTFHVLLIGKTEKKLKEN